jgi:hypothetical protein
VSHWENDFKEKQKMLRSISEFPQFYEEREKKHFGSTTTVRKSKKSRSPEKLPAIKQPGITVQKRKRFKFIL